MTWLSENPWPLAGALAVVAVGLLIALRLTQQGKYLIGALAALAVALVLIAVEQFWVTDNERIEDVVTRLGNAVARSDADAAVALMTDDVTLSQPGGGNIGGPQAKALRRVLPGLDEAQANPARAAIRAAITNAKFDFVSVSQIRAHAGAQSRRGQANIRVHTAGTYQANGVSWNFATDPSGTDWVLGFREQDGRWMIESISATRLPRGWRLPLGGAL